MSGHSLSGEKNPDPFTSFETSAEIIRLAVMLSIRFPRSLRNVEDLRHERGINVCCETASILVELVWTHGGRKVAAFN